MSFYFTENEINGMAALIPRSMNMIPRIDLNFGASIDGSMVTMKHTKDVLDIKAIKIIRVVNTGSQAKE